MMACTHDKLPEGNIQKRDDPPRLNHRTMFLAVPEDLDAGLLHLDLHEAVILSTQRPVGQGEIAHLSWE